jgi:hypothetical protein
MRIVASASFFVGFIAVAAIGAADRVSAQALNKLPPAAAPCSVLSGRPCHPWFCSVFHRGPCFPQYLPPIGENLRLTIVSSDDSDDAGGTSGQITSGSETNAAGETNKGSAEKIDKNAAVESNKSDNEGNSAAEEKPLDSIRAMFAALRSCWVPPPRDSARHGMEYTIRFAFKRDGELIAPPRTTYASHDAPAEVRNAYRDAVNATLTRCTPLHFSDGMAGAVAGRPIAIRFVDDRSTEKSLQ